MKSFIRLLHNRKPNMMGGRQQWKRQHNFIFEAYTHVNRYKRSYKVVVQQKTKHDATCNQT